MRRSFTNPRHFDGLDAKIHKDDFREWLKKQKGAWPLPSDMQLAKWFSDGAQIEGEEQLPTLDEILMEAKSEVEALYELVRASITEGMSNADQDTIKSKTAWLADL